MAYTSFSYFTEYIKYFYDQKLLLYLCIRVGSPLNFDIELAVLFYL